MSTASASLELASLMGVSGSRPAVASSSSLLLERARARLERSRPWAQSSQGNSRSRASSTATTTSTTSACQLSFIPPPPLRTAARARSTSSSSGRDSSLSFIPAPTFSYASTTTRPESLRSQASTVSTSSSRPSLKEISSIAPRRPTTTVQSRQASTHSAKASTATTSSSASTLSSAHRGTATGSSTAYTRSSATGSSANTISTRTRTRTRTKDSAYRILQASRQWRMDLDSRRPSAAPTLSSASSSIRTKASTVTSSSSRSLESLSFIAPRTARPTGTRPPPSTTSSRTDASLLGLSFICPPAKGTRAPSSVSSKTDASLLGLSFIPPRIPATGSRSPSSTASTCSSAPQSLPTTSEVLARARAVRAAAELRKASAFDNRKPVSRPPIARQVSTLAPSLRHHSLWSAESGSESLLVRRSPATSDKTSSSPPPPAPALKSILRGALRESGESCPVKRVRFGDDHSERELQDVKVTVYRFKRWIGILQLTEPGSWIWENGKPLCGVGRGIHCYPDPRRIVNGNLVGWELVPGTTHDYGYTWGSSRMAPTSIDNGGPLSYTHKGCKNVGCNRYPNFHQNANGPSGEVILRLPEWNMNHVFRPDIPSRLRLHDDDSDEDW